MDFDYLMEEIAPDNTEVTLKQNQTLSDIIMGIKEIAKGKIAYDYDTNVYTVCNINFKLENVYALTMYCDESVEITLFG